MAWRRLEVINRFRPWRWTTSAGLLGPIVVSTKLDDQPAHAENLVQPPLGEAKPAHSVIIYELDLFDRIFRLLVARHEALGTPISRA